MLRFAEGINWPRLGGRGTDDVGYAADNSLEIRLAGAASVAS